MIDWKWWIDLLWLIGLYRLQPAHWAPRLDGRGECASRALAPLPLVFSHNSEKSLCGAGVSAETAHHNFEMKPFYRNWLRSIVDVQQDFPSADPLDHRSCGSQGRSDCVGAVTDTVPHPPGTFGTRPADPSWSSSFDLTYLLRIIIYGIFVYVCSTYIYTCRVCIYI